MKKLIIATAVVLTANTTAISWARTSHPKKINHPKISITNAGHKGYETATAD